MTFEPWKKDSFLIRFEHLLAKGEDPELSKAVTLNLTQIFPGDFEFSELTLAANQFFDDMNRRHFKQEGARAFEAAKSSSNGAQPRKVLESPMITLNPMEIKTFLMAPPPGNGSIKAQVFRFFPLIALAVIVKYFLKI